MVMTRARAEALLNKTQMRLYDDSRINSLRRLEAPALERRIERIREMRDKARDKGRPGPTRAAAGTPATRKAARDARDRVELLGDILKRFQEQLKVRRRADREAARRTATAKAPKRAAPAGARARKAPATAASKAAGPPAGKARKSAGAGGTKKAAADGASRKRRMITPDKALENTRSLLEAQRKQARRPAPWPGAEPHGHGADGDPGYQSDQAAQRAADLHAGEARIPAIQGSVGTRGRLSQGKRDRRPGSEK